MSDNPLAARLRRIEAQVAFAAETWGLPHSQREGLRTFQRELVESIAQAERLWRLLLESPPASSGDEVLEPVFDGVLVSETERALVRHVTGREPDDERRR